jgi:hypothetical protein
MLLEEQALLADLKSLAAKAPEFIAYFKSGDLTTEDQQAYAHRLQDLAERLTVHAEARAWVGEEER